MQGNMHLTLTLEDKGSSTHSRQDRVYDQHERSKIQHKNENLQTWIDDDDLVFP